MAEAPKKSTASKMALAIANAAVKMNTRVDWKPGKGIALFLGVREQESGDVILKLKIAEQMSEGGNTVGDVVGHYLGVANTDGQMRAINYGEYLKFTLSLFNVEPISKPEDITDAEAVATYSEYVKELADTIDGMLSKDLLVGRGMLIGFNTFANNKGKVNPKTGTPYLNTIFSHVAEGNDEESIAKRRAELDAAKELP